MALTDPEAAVIDDLSRPHPMTACGTAWSFMSDQVMGGVSSGTLTREVVAGRMALRLRGDVSLDNNGGFVQAALNLRPDGAAMDASAFAGIVVTVWGREETYNLHLRTDAIERPWQSYRQSFVAEPRWREIILPFQDMEAHRVEAPFDPRSLRRIGLVAIGRAFAADLAIADVRFV